MPAEVYSATKPAAPYRAWVLSVLLLLVACVLAANVVRQGAGTWRPGSLIEPEGWEIAFRAPAQFEEVQAPKELFGAVYIFRQTDADGRLLEMLFWRLRADGQTSAGKIAQAIVDKSRSWLSLFVGPPATRSLGRLGNREAVEILEPTVPMVVRAAILPSGWSYAVSLRIEGGPIDTGLYALFDMTCRSVRVAIQSQKNGRESRHR